MDWKSADSLWISRFQESKSSDAVGGGRKASETTGIPAKILQMSRFIRLNDLRTKIADSEVSECAGPFRSANGLRLFYHFLNL